MSLSFFALIAVILVIALHCCFMVLEMFLWDKPVGLKIFNQSKELASKTRILAANQGLYNGFLAAGLIWGIYLGVEGLPVIIFFLSFIVVAGIFGSLTASHTILYIQSLPALIAIILIYFL